MKHLLAIEYIGYNADRDYWSFWRLVEKPLGIKPTPPFAPSVCELYLDENEEIRREYLKGDLDFSGANSEGSRGVRQLYRLEEYRLYRIESKPSWRRRDVSWLVWEGGRKLEFNEEEKAIAWLTKYFSDAPY